MQKHIKEKDNQGERTLSDVQVDYKLLWFIRMFHMALPLMDNHLTEKQVKLQLAPPH